jgi:hypothetical protein
MPVLSTERYPTRCPNPCTPPYSYLKASAGNTLAAELDG